MTAYHKLVKTTPNPKATKNSRGELEAPWLLLSLLLEFPAVGSGDKAVDVADGREVSDAEGKEVGDGVALSVGFNDDACRIWYSMALATKWAPPAKASLIATIIAEVKVVVQGVFRKWPINRQSSSEGVHWQKGRVGKNVSTLWPEMDWVWILINTVGFWATMPFTTNVA